MGRVDEALRRAAEGGRRSGGETIAFEPQEAVVPGADAVELARGFMPSEPEAPAGHISAGTRTPAAGGADGTPAVPERSLLERIDSGLERKVVIDRQMDAAAREQYRRLAATLHNAQAQTGIRTVMIASAVAGEGKTLTAANLSLTLSESYRRNVLLIDADLRRPSLHIVFNVPGSPGLTDGLTSVEEQKLPLHQVSPRLTVLAAGTPSGDPMAGLSSARMHRLIAEAREAFDWVVIDTPPVGILTDANLLASTVDATVMVVKADSTPYELVTRAVEILGSERLMGVVLNRASVSARPYDYRSYARYENGGGR